MTAYHSTDPRFYHPSGAEYTVSVYEVDTVIPLTTYADKDRTAMNPWPVVLEDDGVGNGYATIYINAEFATINLRDIDGVSVDGYPLTWVKPAQQDEVDAIDARLVLNGATDVTQTEAIGVIQADVTALDGRLDAAEGTIITHTSQIGALQSADTALDGRLDAAEATIITHTGQIGALQSADTVLDGRLDAAEPTILTHTSQIGALQSADTALDGRLDAAEATIITHTGQIGALQSADTALDGRLDALEAIDHAAPTGSTTANYTGSFYDPTTHTLMQWGTATTASDGSALVTFPTAFTTFLPNVQLTPNWSSGYQHATGINLENTYLNSFYCLAGYITNGTTVWEGDAISFKWFATGNKT